MMTMMLPIPAKKAKIEFFFVPYNIEDGYINKKAYIQARDTESISTLRSLLEKKHEVNRSSYIICKVHDNEIQNYFSSN
jgi:hypothetical protein